MNIEAFPCYTDYLNIVREFDYGTMQPLDFQKIHSYPPFGERGVKMLWVSGRGPKVYAYTFLSTSKHIQLPIEFGQFSEKQKFIDTPFFGGGVKKVMRGAGGPRVCARKKNPNQSIFTCPFNYNKISPPTPPPLGRPWGTSLHRQPQFFYGSYDSRYPKDSKSAKKYFP